MNVGEVHLRRSFDPALMRDRLDITQADPIARITEEIITEIMYEQNPWATIDIPSNVLTLNGDNRKVIYVIDREGYDPQTRTYLMRWPD